MQDFVFVCLFVCLFYFLFFNCFLEKLWYKVEASKYVGDLILTLNLQVPKQVSMWFQINTNALLKLCCSNIKEHSSLVRKVKKSKLKFPIQSPLT